MQNELCQVRQMRIRSTKLRALLLVSLIFFGCRFEEAGDSAGRIRLFPSDEAVMAAVYDPTYSVPDDFFIDERAGTEGSYTIYHVKDASLSYELCKDDMSGASVLEEADDQSRVVSGALVGSIETSRYFEFERELSYPDSIGNISDTTTPGFARVFKCSYVNRDGVDRHLRSGYAGTLNVRPLRATDVKELAEYLWQFTFFWPSRAAVIGTYSEGRPESFEHTLILAIVTSQGFAGCDLVEVVEWRFSAARTNGEVTKQFELVRQFKADVVGGVPRRCDD